ncbi:DUF72 domain-containing protein [Pelagibius litoralis]|uniref:DUF72 domain-containing protein n=1 Tax=Pelagibius litoralis TaxID=374515 RepID=A0A967F1N0_9PROT|nr:DUF72 domain-containing protein [Pelagibius litoralis]NIA71454.1 DUF72 domain-containing protein [Pelagibius litoralis]
MKRLGSLHIGTCGWHYKHWAGPFYPADSKSSAMLKIYTQQFSSVEIDNSFYRLPSLSSLHRWKSETPDDFTFTCKASRYITHMKKLKDPARSLPAFFERIGNLGDKLKVVVFQLPPRWRCNLERLEQFLAALPSRYRCAFEFRDESWFNPAVYAALVNYGAAFCIYDLGGRRAPPEITSDFVYLRLHGPGKAYAGAYSPRRLAHLAAQIGDWRQDGLDIFVFFDNDAEGHAPRDALRLKRLLERT